MRRENIDIYCGKCMKEIDISDDEKKSCVLPEIDKNCTLGFILKQISNLAYTNINVNESKTDEITKRLFEAREVVMSFAPRNNQELMLATQMATIHQTQQRLSMHMFNSNLDPVGMMSYTNMITKLSNTFIHQLNAMQKLKGNNQQKVTIEHVHVHNGGQAVVGTVHTTDPGEKK